MERLVGIVFIAIGVGLFFMRDRLLAANQASSSRLFGRADPNRLAPGFMAFWNRAILLVVCSIIVVMGGLILVGAVTLD